MYEHMQLCTLSTNTNQNTYTNKNANHRYSSFRQLCTLYTNATESEFSQALVVTGGNRGRSGTVSMTTKSTSRENVSLTIQLTPPRRHSDSDLCFLFHKFAYLGLFYHLTKETIKQKFSQLGPNKISFFLTPSFSIMGFSIRKASQKNCFVLGLCPKL